MKNILIKLSVALFALTSTATQAVTIAGLDFADDAIAIATGTSESTFLNWDPANDDAGVSTNQLITDLSDTNAGTYIFSYDNDAYIDMSFTDVNVIDGEGADLAIFFVGSGGHTGTIDFEGLGSIAFPELFDTGYHVNELFGENIESPIYVAYIDLAMLGFEGDVSIRDFRLSIAGASAVPSLVAAINTTAVPLPAPLLLLLSGLAGLGLFGRKK